MSLFDPGLLFPVIAAAFLALSGRRYLRHGRRADVTVRTWLRLALLFGLVSGGLWIYRLLGS